jgi:hypothetical protein
MRSVVLTIAIVAGLVAGCAQPPVTATSSSDTGIWHRDAPGTIWRKNRIPDGGN